MKIKIKKQTIKSIQVVLVLLVMLIMVITFQRQAKESGENSIKTFFHTLGVTQ